MNTLADIIVSKPPSNIEQLHKDCLNAFKSKGLKESMPYAELIEQERLRILDLLPDLSQYKIQIFQYTEFDFLKYNIEEMDYSISIAYKPKNVAVSFWTAPFKDCKIIKHLK